MSDPLRPARRFDHEAEASAPLAGPQAFDAGQVIPPAPASTDAAAVDSAIVAPRGRRPLLWLLLAVAGLATAELIQLVATAWTEGSWLPAGWAAAGLAAMAIAGRTLLKELWRLRHLRRHAALRERAEALRLSDERDGGLDLCNALRKEADIASDDLRWQTFLQGDHSHLSDRERLDRFSRLVLADSDREARRLVTRAATDVALVVAVSPLAWVDMAMMAWRTVRLLDRVARLYGLQLGYAARVRLFRTLLANLALTGAGEIASDIAADLVALGAAGRVSTRVAQGLAAGLLTARFGLRALNACRPLPFRDDEQPRLAALRRELLTQLRTLASERPAPARSTEPLARE